MLRPDDYEEGCSFIASKKGIISPEELNIMRKEFKRGDRNLTREEITFIHEFKDYINRKLIQSNDRDAPIHIQCWDLIHGPLATHRDIGVFTGKNIRVIEFLEQEYKEAGYVLTIGPNSVVIETRETSVLHWICCCFHQFIN